MRTIFLSTIFVILFCSLSGQNIDKICYFEKNTVTWDDIKEVDVTNDTIREEAFIFSTFELELVKVNPWTGKSKFRGYAIYIPSKSWVKQDCKNDRNLLYSQTIFDLNQLYAKKIEYKFNKKYDPFFGSLDEQITKAMAEYGKEYTKDEIKFNKETDYGKDIEKIKEWNTKIKTETLKIKNDR